MRPTRHPQDGPLGGFLLLLRLISKFIHLLIFIYLIILKLTFKPLLTLKFIITLSLRFAIQLMPISTHTLILLLIVSLRLTLTYIHT